MIPGPNYVPTVFLMVTDRTRHDSVDNIVVTNEHLGSYGVPVALGAPKK